MMIELEVDSIGESSEGKWTTRLRGNLWNCMEGTVCDLIAALKLLPEGTTYELESWETYCSLTFRFERPATEDEIAERKAERERYRQEREAAELRQLQALQAKFANWRR